MRREACCACQCRRGRSGARCYLHHRWSYRPLRKRRRWVICSVRARRCCSTPATAKTSSSQMASRSRSSHPACNFPTGIAFRGDSHHFEVYVLESGVFPTSRCNDGVAWQSKGLPGNPFTPDIRVFDQRAKLLRTLGKSPDASSETTGAFSPKAVVDIAFEHGLAGGRLFATDNASDGGRIVTVDPDDRESGSADHRASRRPDRTAGISGRLDLLGRWLHDKQRRRQQSRRRRFRAARRSVPGHHPEPERIRLGRRDLYQRLFQFGHTNPGGTVAAFFNANTGKVRPGVCNGAVLRAPLNNMNAIEPFSWGYRDGYAIRFAPYDHPCGRAARRREWRR